MNVIQGMLTLISARESLGVLVTDVHSEVKPKFYFFCITRIVFDILAKQV